jgi:Tfp pilus assembly protein PilO
MAFPRLAATEALLALRWPGALGVLLLVAAAGWGLAVLLPAQEPLAATELRLARAERRAAAIASGAEAAPQSAASRRQQFYAGLPAQHELTQQVERIYAAAAAEQLSLLHGEYTGTELPAAGLLRYRIVLPLKGSYGQVRRFAAAAAAAVPGLALDELSLQRQHVAEAQVEARLQLSLFLVKR